MKSLISFLTVMVLGMPAFSQELPFVQLCLYQEGDTLWVAGRMDQPFEGFISWMNFAITSDHTDVQFQNPISLEEEILGFHRIGLVETLQGQSYQKFIGIGLQSLTEAGREWKEGEAIHLFKISVSDSTANYRLVDEMWTDSLSKGRYLELNGTNQTGSIFFDCAPPKDTLIPPEPELILGIHPNPTKDILTLGADDSIQKISIIDLKGRHVPYILLEHISDKEVKLDISHLAEGIYYVQLILPTNILTYPLYKQ